MILTNGITWRPVTFGPLTHAHWVGLSLADLGLPCFLVMVGITTSLAIGRRRSAGASDGALVKHALRRSALLFLIGLAGNAFASPDLAHLRIPGVLQRIAVTYLLAFVMALRVGVRGRLVTAATLLVAYWLALTLIPVPASPFGPASLARPETTLAAWVDRGLLGSQHVSQTGTWDPEGVISTIPAIASALMGTMIGDWLRRPLPMIEHAAALQAIGSLAIALGVVWSWSFPIIKALWTSSFALVTAGATALALGTLVWVIDVRAISRWTTPLVAFGVNSLVLYVGSVALLFLLGLPIARTSGYSVSLRQLAYDAAFAPWLEPAAASLGFGAAYMLVWLVPAWWMYNRRLRIRV